MKVDEPRQNRIPFMMSDTELAAVDKWRFSNRIGTRAEAIRRLCQIGLAFDKEAEPIMKRSERALQALLLTMDKIPAEQISGLPNGIKRGFSAAIDEQLKAYKAAVAAYLQATIMSETKYGAEVEDLAEAAAAFTAKLREKE